MRLLFLLENIYLFISHFTPQGSGVCGPEISLHVGWIGWYTSSGLSLWNSSAAVHHWYLAISGGGGAICSRRVCRKSRCSNCIRFMDSLFLSYVAIQRAILYLSMLL